ncbi:histidine phosphatase family protein [Liquorilactobacillus satsumensis]|uniref:histidine phosphatase family protein n=1 Tax=Liquorilactobacillus satsumensis TaxID=259059 RepID=UPI0021C2751A|nr:histidine phosphatase family protein [Liquorilactobacillus satsumensis]MCP9313495.1 histidine phosphatase family protein [Liquorilactobacillus satsumensis]MCP9360120.1 histidine phosphatase family protein [Liquorilactobacillus satsumensis]
MPFTVYFVRHGQTIFNFYNRMQGWCDSPLTQKGINDAHKAGAHLADKDFANIYHSDTMRAQNTCKIIMSENQLAADLPQPVTLSNFREQSYGYFEGNDSNQTWLMVGATRQCRNYEEIITRYSINDSRDFMKETDPFNDAENNAEYWKRIDAGFDYLNAHQAPGSNALVVSHGTTIRSIVSRFAPEIDVVSVGPKNGSVTKMIVTGKKVEIVYFNHYLDTQEY